jgi:hypothetical protein
MAIKGGIKKAKTKLANQLMAVQTDEAGPIA